MRAERPAVAQRAHGRAAERAPAASSSASSGTVKAASGVSGSICAARAGSAPVVGKGWGGPTMMRRARAHRRIGQHPRAHQRLLAARPARLGQHGLEEVRGYRHQPRRLACGRRAPVSARPRTGARPCAAGGGAAGRGRADHGVLHQVALRRALREIQRPGQHVHVLRRGRELLDEALEPGPVVPGAARPAAPSGSRSGPGAGRRGAVHPGAAPVEALADLRADVGQDKGVRHRVLRGLVVGGRRLRCSARRRPALGRPRGRRGAPGAPGGRGQSPRRESRTAGCESAARCRRPRRTRASSCARRPRSARGACTPRPVCAGTAKGSVPLRIAARALAGDVLEHPARVAQPVVVAHDKVPEGAQVVAAGRAVLERAVPQDAGLPTAGCGRHMRVTARSAPGSYLAVHSRRQAALHLPQPCAPSRVAAAVPAHR